MQVATATVAMGYYGAYISRHGKEGLKRYQYRGSDNSLLYNYVLNPVYNRLVLLFPMWLAPNLITVIGFLAIVVSHVVTLYYSPNMHEEAPRLVYALNGFAVLFYQMMDALDGKQARRTGSSSPLGLIFDHGCDALNVTVSALTLSSSLAFGPTWKAIVCWSMGAATFYFATWEEYFTHEMKLPFINGPNEGLWIAASFHFVSAIYGPQFWTTTDAYGYQRNVYVIVTTVALGIITILSNLLNVYLCIRKTKRSDPSEHSETALLSASHLVAATRMIPTLFLFGLMNLWIVFSPHDIMTHHPRIVLFTCGFLLGKLVTQLMVAHITDELYKPWSKTITLAMFIGGHGFFSILHYKDIIELWHEEILLYELFYVSAISYAHMVVSLVWELCAILRIRCFRIQPQVKQE